ncbi:MAG TPA: UbiA family prenyltransferase [Fulvivirga sp.]|nr:UbiA family prenyltransferase [Fulvivirga sp.]
MGLNPSLITITILGLTVWSIYTFDHLLDSRKGDLKISTERHLFHLKYQRQLSKFILVVLLLIGGLIFLLPTKTLVLGTALGLIVLAYFLSMYLINWKSIIHKELTIAIVYTLGVMVGPLSVFNGVFEAYLMLIIATFFVIVLLNLLIFSIFDSDADSTANFPSLIQRVGDKWSKILIVILSALAVLMLTSIYSLGFRKESGLLLGMLLILQVIYWFKTNGFIKENYRYLGDGVFILPILYLL